MSSSKIIKSHESDTVSMSEYSFKAISGAALSPAEKESFIPLDIFDSADARNDQQEQNTVPEPQGEFLSEEELDMRLRESFKNGLQEGKNLAERGLLNVFRSLRSAAEEIRSLRDKVLRESEDEIINLIMKVARKVIQREVFMDRKILLSVIQAAIADISSREEIVIRLNPDDYYLTTSSSEEMVAKELLTEKMRLKPDPAVMVGSCKVETEMGTIDASIDGQLDEILRRMLEERSATPESA